MPLRKSLKRSKKVSRKISKRLRTMKRNSRRMSRKSMKRGGCGSKRKLKRSMSGGNSRYSGGGLGYIPVSILHR